MDGKKLMISSVMVVLSIAIIFQFVSNSTTSLTDSANAVRFPNNCSDSTDSTGEELWYNVTAGACYNSSHDEVVTPVFYSLPLSTLFASNGVALLIVMAAVIILLITVILTWAKNKGG